MKTRNFFTATAMVVFLVLALLVSVASADGPVNLGNNVWEGEQFDLSTVSDPAEGNVLFIQGDYLGNGGCDAATFDTAADLIAAAPGPGTWSLYEATPTEVAGMVADLGECTLHFTPVEITEPPADEPGDVITGTVPVTSTVPVTTTGTVTTTMPANPVEAIMAQMPGDTPEWVTVLLQILLPMAMSYQPAPAQPAVQPAPPTDFEIEEGAVIDRVHPITESCASSVAKAQPIKVSSTMTDTKVVLEDIGLTKWAAQDEVCWPSDPDVIYVGHGDLRGNGRCEVMVWTADSAPNLGGTARIYTVDGDTDLALEYAKWAAEQYHGSPCPIVEPRG